MADRSKLRTYALWIAIALVVLYVGAGGAAKLASVPYVHSSFPKLGLPAWFGYFIGACEVLGCIALFIRPLRALAALGIGIIMIGATYYHSVYTPVVPGGARLRSLDPQRLYLLDHATGPAEVRNRGMT